MMEVWSTHTLATIILLIAAGNLNAGITSAYNANGNSSADGSYVLVQEGLIQGAEVHIDRTHTFNTLPPGMTGLDYIKTANDDKGSTELTLDLTVDGPTKLYLSLDNRLGNGETTTNPPSLGTATGTQWVIDQGWVQTTQTWEKVGDPGHPYTVYTLDCLADEATLYGQNAGNMYSVAGGPSTNTIIPYAFIDIGPDGQRVEPGWQRLIDDPANNTGNIAYGPTSFVARTFEKLILSTDEVDWRDKGNATNDWELVRVAEDFVKDNAGDITLTLENLHQGHYTAKSYHIDSATNQSPRIQVYVSDCASSNRLLNTYGNSGAILGSVNLLTTEIIESTAAAFEFWANGTDPVTIRFRGTPGISTSSADTEAPLNGIELTLNTVSYPPLIERYALIDIGPSGQRPATNSITLPGAPSPGNNVSYGPTDLTADDDSTFSITIDNRNTNGVSTGGIDWRDRGDSTLTNDLSRLGEDFIKNNNGIIRVTLGNMKAGTYRIVGFHNDSDNYQCENILVYVTDANGTAVVQTLSGDANFARRTINDITVKGIWSTATAFEVQSDGANDIILYFDGTAANDTEVPLNGLQIEKVTDTSLPPVYPKGSIMMVR